MKALGLIEVRGMVPAVEALDSALKAANVNRLDVVKVGGGLVSVLIEGDVGAVRAAVDAAQAAAEKIGTVISTHVIPRPASEVTEMITPDPDPQPEKSEQPKDNYDETAEAEQPEDSSEVTEEVKEEPAEHEEADKEETQEKKTAAASGKLAYIPDVEEMKAMTVDKLRALARKLEITNMTRKEIRFANKTELIEKICEFLGAIQSHANDQ